MDTVIKIKNRLAGGLPGPPDSLEHAELAFNEQDNTLYYGSGDGGEGGKATQVIAIGGSGAFTPVAHVGSGGVVHADVVAAGASGFMSGADKTKLNAITGTNTGDNAANTTYANDYRAANFVAGINYLAPNGSAAALTGLTSDQVTTALGYTPAAGGGMAVSVISTNTTAVSGTVYVLTASLTLTLPASPSAGALVTISNRSGVSTCAIASNAQNIMGLAQDMTLDINASFQLVFANATQGWVLL